MSYDREIIELEEKYKNRYLLQIKKKQTKKTNNRNQFCFWPNNNKSYVDDKHLNKLHISQQFSKYF